MTAGVMHRNQLIMPNQVTLPVWRSFVPGAFTAVVESGLLARFLKVDSKLVITGFFPKGSIITRREREGRYKIVYKAISRAVLKPIGDSDQEFSSEHDLSQPLEILVLRNTGSSEERIIWLFSKFLDGKDSGITIVELGAKAIAVCSMLSIRQVTRILPQLEADKVITLRPDKSIVINPASSCFTEIKALV